MTPIGDGNRAIGAFAEGRYLQGAGFAAMAALNAMPAEGMGAGAVKLVDGMHLPVGKALDAAADFLGAGYREMSGGRFLSSDGLRQVRMSANDLLGKHGAGPHINLDRLAPNPAKPGKNMIVEKIHILLTDP